MTTSLIALSLVGVGSGASAFTPTELEASDPLPAAYAALIEPIAAGMRACFDADEAEFEEDDVEPGRRDCVQETSLACHASAEDASTTHGIVMCNRVLHVVWDAEMNRLWPLLQAERTAERRLSAMAAQRAWVVYRDLECRDAANRQADGSMVAYAGGSCIVGMTARRVAALRAELRS